jgi:hypothetical protein
MEGVGVALSAYSSETLPGFLLAKGISDWADPSKGDDWQRYAAEASAAFITGLLQEQPFAPRTRREPVRRRARKRYPGQVKLAVIKRLTTDWIDLADYFEIDPSTRARFQLGDGPRRTWEYLDEREKLDELEDALRFINRHDLADELDAAHTAEKDDITQLHGDRALRTDAQTDTLIPREVQPRRAASVHDHGEDSGTAQVAESPQDDRFDACADGQTRLALERNEAERDHADIWWESRPGRSGRWFGQFFAFWRRTETLPCDRITFDYREPVASYPQGHYNSARFGIFPSQDGGYIKPVVVHATPGFFEEADLRLFCGLTSWKFAHGWAEPHAAKLLTSGVRPSVFGVSGRLAFPGITVVHALLCTADGFIVFSLRSRSVASFRLRWSASFEEGVRLDKRQHVHDREDGDRTVLDTVLGGLREEFALGPSEVASHSCLALGREYVRHAGRFEPRDAAGRTPTEHVEGINLNFGILVGVRLTVDVATLWSIMQEREETAEGLDEHCAWVGVRLSNLGQVDDVMTFAQRRHNAGDLFGGFARETDQPVDVSYCPMGQGDDATDYGFHSTSAARLYLGCRWLGIGSI